MCNITYRWTGKLSSLSYAAYVLYRTERIRFALYIDNAAQKKIVRYVFLKGCD